MNHRASVILVLSVVLVATTSRSWADAFDIPFLVSTEHRSTPYIFATVFFLMLPNFLVNLVFVGLPIFWYASVPVRRILGGMFLLTLVGQVVDWLGRTIATLVASRIPNLLGGYGMEAFQRTLIVSDLVISGAWVGFAVYALAGRWCSVPVRQAVVISLLAAVVTNPGWAVGVWLQAGLVSPAVA